jgi:RNA polymerase sigma-70 factor (sigma-E family)
MTTGGRWRRCSGDDDLLSRLYQQLSDQQVARFGGGYDLAAGQDRYRAWLADHVAEDEAARAASQPAAIMAGQVGAGGIGPVSPARRGVAPVAAGQTAPESSDTSSRFRGITADWGAGRAVTALYSVHYRPLVRLAAVLVGDLCTAEEIVQDSFVGLHASWRRLADSDRALAYLRQAVVNRSRSVLRQRVFADKLAPKMASEVPTAAPEEIAPAERSALVSVLQALPPRQREVLVLRYYADLSEAQIASTMGISRGAVKSQTARAMSALHARLRRAADGASAEPGDPTADR